MIVSHGTHERHGKVQCLPCIPWFKTVAPVKCTCQTSWVADKFPHKAFSAVAFPACFRPEREVPGCGGRGFRLCQRCSMVIFLILPLKRVALWPEPMPAATGVWESKPEIVADRRAGRQLRVKAQGRDRDRGRMQVENEAGPVSHYFISVWLCGNGDSWFGRWRSCRCRLRPASGC